VTESVGIATQVISGAVGAAAGAAPTDFGPPRLVAELAKADATAVDGFLTDDGLTLFYSSAALGHPAEIFVTRRLALSERFTLFQPLSDVNTTFDERDPWLSPDGTKLFFASDRDGTMSIYEADAASPTGG